MRFLQPATLATLAALNLFISFGYQWLPVVKHGVGAATDALFVSTLVPQIVLSIVSGSLASVLTPMLATADAASFRAQAWTFAQVMGLASAVANGLLGVAAPLWVPWIVPGFDAANTALTVSLVRVQLIGAVATMFLMVGWSAYHARRQFVWVEVSGSIAGVVGLLWAWWAMPGAGVMAFAWGMTVRAVVQVLLLLPGLGPYARPSWRHADGTTVWRRVLPLLGGATYYKLDPLLERLLASFAPVGHLSVLHLAQQVYAAGSSILTKALINPVLPTLAQAASQRAWPAVEAMGRRRLLIVVSCAAAAWLPLLVVGRPAMQAALAPWLPPDEISRLHAVLMALAGVWLGGLAGQLLTVGFFAVGETRTPTLVGVIGFTLAIPVKILGFIGWGVVGLAAASSAGSLGNAITHRLLLSRHLRRRAAADALGHP